MARRQRKLNWLLVAGVLGAGCSAFMIGGAVATDGLFGQATAAWVQGLGSIAAIVAAIWIDRSAARRREEQWWDEYKDAWMTVAFMLAEAVDLLGVVRETLEQPQRITGLRKQLRAMSATVQNLTQKERMPGGAVIILTQAATDLEATRGALDDLSHAAYITRAREVSRDALGSMRDLLERTERSMRDLNIDPMGYRRPATKTMQGH